MKVAIDPYMFRTTPLLELPGVVADLGFEYIELSPREDLTPFFLHPRIDDSGVKRFKGALDAAGVKVAAHLPLYRWSGPDEDERQAAVRYWKRAIQITVDLDCRVMNSEFNGRPEQASLSEGMFWKSMEELLPVFEREGVELRLEPHPDDFVEDGLVAVDMVRGINSPLVSFLYCAPHTFHMGGNMVEIMEYAGPLMTQLHLADAFDHTASSGLRYIVNPPGSTARVHQHLDIGQGEVDWDLFFATLKRLGFGDSDRNIMTACVFAWEDRARESSLFMREAIRKHTSDGEPLAVGRPSRCRRGRALDQGRRQEDMGRIAVGLVLPGEDRLGGVGPDVDAAVVDRGQLQVVGGGQGGVVVPDDRDVLGHGEVTLAQGGQRPEEHDVVGGEDPGDVGQCLEQGERGDVPVSLGGGAAPGHHGGRARRRSSWPRRRLGGARRSRRRRSGDRSGGVRGRSGARWRAGPLRRRRWRRSPPRAGRRSRAPATTTGTLPRSGNRSAVVSIARTMPSTCMDKKASTGSRRGAR